jgi:uncharacterized protein (TIGR02452 family)
MKRSTRTELAKQTLEILERGSYRAPAGHEVDLTDRVSACVDDTVLFSPDELERIRRQELARGAAPRDTTIEVVNETTLAAIARLSRAGHTEIAALNFASAKNPGGGFLNGTQAQEESLARSSALYVSLLEASSYYDEHRASPSLLYSDRMILSPACPIFRDDDGELLNAPDTVTFITSPAPNAGAMDDHRRDERARIPDVLRRRSEYVLALAASRGCECLVLGAWGCGVFRNSPELVANTFAGHLRGSWLGRFAHVAFSVLDRASPPETLRAFQDAFRI